ncbi:MAG: hypothetical protein IKX28_00005 [Bacteroidales bacterium]|nr:hypothetical protein [Bacteroidales bacterium]
MKTRKFNPGAPLHIYFLAKGGYVLFYRTSDRLCFYSVLSVLSRRYNVTVLGVSIMFTHVHLMVRVADLAQLRLFMGQLLKTFSLIIKKDRSLEGPQFKTPFGSASKATGKEQRSSLIYLLNNPVEKKLCRKAADDRWTFLAYFDNPYPFSKPLVKRNASFRLRRACELIDGESRAGRYLRPHLLRRTFASLSKSEQDQLVDYIVGAYRFIDYREALALFGTMDRLLLATEVSTGKEFDIGEDFDPQSDIAYCEMLRIVAKAHLLDGWKLLHLAPEEQRHWTLLLKRSTQATDRQVRKFLHLPEKPA